MLERKVSHGAYSRITTFDIARLLSIDEEISFLARCKHGRCYAGVRQVSGREPAIHLTDLGKSRDYNAVIIELVTGFRAQA